jgi:hypothetical protein
MRELLLRTAPSSAGQVILWAAVGVVLGLLAGAAAAPLGGIAMLLPVLAFWIGRAVERRKACTKDPAGDILPTSGGPT